MDHHNQNLNKPILNSEIDFLIIGGGIASLAAANRLLDLNQRALLVEGKHFPSHKVCGEFLSPEALPFLKKWGIVPQCKIKKVKLFSGQSELEFLFPYEAASISRYQLDDQLAKRAKKDILIIENCQVLKLEKIETTSHYLVKLSNGQELTAKNLLIGSGRFFEEEQKSGKNRFPYFGFKAHFSGLDIQENLEMYLFKNGYLGMSHVEKDVLNVACLLKTSKKIEEPLKFIDEFLNSKEGFFIKEKLTKGTMIFKEWLYTKAPAFGMKKNPLLKNVYFIGDAAGTIPPATGNGLSIALTSGLMAADYAILGDYKGFRKAFQKRYRARIRKGKLLHKLMMSPSLSTISFFLSKKMPFIPKYIFSSTRET